MSLDDGDAFSVRTKPCMTMAFLLVGGDDDGFKQRHK